VLRHFASPDPMVSNPLDAQSFNRYSYVANDPINRVDPSGFDYENDDDSFTGGETGGSGLGPDVPTGGVNFGGQTAPTGVGGAVNAGTSPDFDSSEAGNNGGGAPAGDAQILPPDVAERTVVQGPTSIKTTTVSSNGMVLVAIRDIQEQAEGSAGPSQVSSAAMFPAFGGPSLVRDGASVPKLNGPRATQAPNPLLLRIALESYAKVSPTLADALKYADDNHINIVSYTGGNATVPSPHVGGFYLPGTATVAIRTDDADGPAYWGEVFVHELKHLQDFREGRLPLDFGAASVAARISLETRAYIAGFVVSLEIVSNSSSSGYLNSSLAQHATRLMNFPSLDVAGWRAAVHGVTGVSPPP